MKWTGADILTQLDEGWEIDEIASATGLGIAEVRRLVRDERYRMRQQIKEEEVADKKTEVEEKETTEAVDIHAWNMISVLAEQPGSPAVATIASRAESEDPKWAHYESIPVEEVEGNWHPRTTTLYRLREGTGWEALEVADPKSKVVNHADQAARIASLERELAKARERVESSHKAMEEAISRQVEVEAEERHIRYAIDVLKEALDVADDGKRYPIDAIASDAAKKLKETRERMIGYRNAWQNAEKQEVVYQTSIEDLQGQVRRRDEKIEKLEQELERVNEALLAVHRECERQGYDADDKRAAVEKVRELIDYTEEVVSLVARQDQRIKELESKRELTLEQTDTPDRHDLPLIVEDWERIKAHLTNGGHPAVGSCLAPTIEKLLEHSTELQDLIRLEADSPNNTTSLLDEILTAADEGNPWPVLYRVARGAGR